MSTKTKKVVSAAAATVLSSLLLLGGTLAWQSISQQALNEASSEVNPGGRLHDDFNGVSNKDIYVENFADEPIYARIRLLEYLEVGDAAGKDLESDDRYDTAGNVYFPAETAEGEPITAEVITPRAIYSDTDTWLPHNFDPNMIKPTGQYFKWTYGGETTYMPTFNMNKDSLQPEINGTLKGLNGLYPWDEAEGQADAYSDYTDYSALGDGYSLSCYEIKDADSNTDDELLDKGIDVYQQVIHPTSELDDLVAKKHIRVSESTVEHVAKETPHASLISINDWMLLYKAALDANGGHSLIAQSLLSPYWVYDPGDPYGWCYYSKPIQGGEATGLLLDKVEPVAAKLDQDNCYYAIYVDAQFITADDIGSEAEKDGFYTDSAPTHEALELLGIIGVKVP